MKFCDDKIESQSIVNLNCGYGLLQSIVIFVLFNFVYISCSFILHGLMLNKKIIIVKIIIIIIKITIIIIIITITIIIIIII